MLNNFKKTKRTKKRKIKKSKTKEIIKENKARKVKRNSLPLSPAPNKPYREGERERGYSNYI